MWFQHLIFMLIFSKAFANDLEVKESLSFTPVVQKLSHFRCLLCFRISERNVNEEGSRLKFGTKEQVFCSFFFTLCVLI
jgi:hypothetical protein